MSELRGKELATIRKSALLFAFNHTLMAAGPILVAAVTFGCFFLVPEIHCHLSEERFHVRFDTFHSRH